MTGGPELHGRARRNLITQVRLEEPNCWLCGHWINQALPPTHRMSSTVDEIIPRSLAADPRRAALTRSNCRHAHRSCNSSRGNGTRTKRRPILQIRSREW